ncbi:MAG: hypothetical protein Q9185_004802 [Variospora sp. 1 TL-2023]
MGLLTLRRFPSPYEASWFASIETAQSNICEAVAKPEHKNASEIIVTRTLELTSLPASWKWETYDTFNTTSFHSSDSFMSRMHYNRTCYDSKTETFNLAKGKGIQLIEPLWGMLRDPFDHWCGDKALHMEGQADPSGQSKAHIMPQGFAPYTYTDSSTPPTPEESRQQAWRTHGLPPWHSSLRPSSDPRVGVAFQPPQNIHLDLGSSYFKVWGSDRGAASGQWFYDTYHARGQPFSRFIAVEVETLNDTTAFQQIPDDLVGVYTLMNVGLTMEEGDKLNTVDMIKRVVKPEDFFVFKLDIDSAPIEEPIVKSLLEDNPDEGGASALIDELMLGLRSAIMNLAAAAVLFLYPLATDSSTPEGAAVAERVHSRDFVKRAGRNRGIFTTACEGAENACNNAYSRTKCHPDGAAGRNMI